MGTIYTDFTKIKVLPIERLTVDYEGESGTEWVDFGLAEQGSTFKKVFVTMPDRATGGQRPVMVKVDIQAFFPYANFQDMQPILSAIATRPIKRVYVRMDALPGQPAGATMSFSFDPANCVVGTYSLTYEQEHTDNWRPRLMITATGRFSMDAETYAGDGGFWNQISTF